MGRVAVLSVHTCPVVRLGEKDTGGMNVYVRQVAAELGRLGNLVDIYTRYHGDEHKEVIDVGPNARLIHLRAGPPDEAKKNLHFRVPGFVEGVRTRQSGEGIYYDLIHSHYWLSGRAGTELNTTWRVPHVATFHTLGRKKLRARVGESEPELRMRSESSTMEAVDAVLVSTPEEQEDVSRLYGVDPGKVRVVPGGVNLALFAPMDRSVARRKLGIGDEKVVLSVGRMEPLKGLDVLLGALQRMDDLGNTRLLIVGGAPGQDRELDRLKHMAGALGVLDRITFAGSVSHGDLPVYYSAADVFAMPSYHESFGLAALEAMACGIPVVASRVGGLKTFVNNGVTGYLIPWHCPEPFAEQLEIVLANPALRDSMGSAARVKAETMGWRKVAGTLAEIYGGLTGKAWDPAAGV